MVGWSLLLEGDEADLSDCLRIFDDPDGPKVQTDDGGYVLRAIEIDKHSDADSAYLEAEEMLARMNGARLLHHQGRPIRLQGSMVSHHQNGGRGAVIRVSGLEMTVRGGVVRFPGPQGSPPDPSIVDLRRSRAFETRADALVFFGRADNWFDLYKAYEAIKASVPRNKLSSAGLIKDRKTEDELTQTINKYRHAYTSYQGPYLSFREAKALVADALKKLLGLP